MEQDSSMTNPLSSPLPPHNNPPLTSSSVPSLQNNPPPPSQTSPITSPPRTQTTSRFPSLLETHKTVEMWESFIQRGIEHDFAQDLAHSNAAHRYSRNFEAESSEFYEKCLEMLQRLPVSPLVMHNIHLITKFLEHQRKRRSSLMKRVGNSVAADNEVESETMATLLDPNKLHLFCKIVEEFSEHLKKKTSDHKAGSSQSDRS